MIESNDNAVGSMNRRPGPAVKLRGVTKLIRQRRLFRSRAADLYARRGEVHLARGPRVRKIARDGVCPTDAGIEAAELGTVSRSPAGGGAGLGNRFCVPGIHS